MTDKAQPFTDIDRLRLVHWAKIVDKDSGTDTGYVRDPVLAARDYLRFEATVVRVEAQRDALQAELAEVTTERDALRRGVDSLIDAGVEMIKTRDAAQAEVAELRRLWHE